MDLEILNSLRAQLQRERRQLIEAVAGNEDEFYSISETPREEFEEQAQRERDALALERLSDTEQDRVQEIDGALARLDAGTYGTCENCGRNISEARLRAEPATRLCFDCAKNAGGATLPTGDDSETVLTAAQLPPDLDGLSDEDLARSLEDLVINDGRIDMQELHITARDGVVYLEGALPSEPEHEMLRNVLTDIAGVQEIVDHLEIQRLAWERSDRYKSEEAREIPPGTYPDREPYAGTEDVTLTNEEGINYDPPDNPPAPPGRKD